MYYYKVTYYNKFDDEERTVYGIVAAKSYAEAMRKITDDDGGFGEEIDFIAIMPESDEVLTKNDINAMWSLLDK